MSEKQDPNHLSARHARQASFPLDYDPFAAPISRPQSRADDDHDNSGLSASRSPHLRAVSPHSFEHITPDDAPSFPNAQPAHYDPPPGRPPFLEDRETRGMSMATSHSSISDNVDGYSRTSKYDDQPAASLVANAKDIERGPQSSQPRLQTLDYQDPYAPYPSNDQGLNRGFNSSPNPNANPTAKERKGLAKFFGDGGRYPMEQRIENKKRGIGRQSHPFVTWALTLAMTGILIYELVYNWRQQGTPFSFHPSVNPMLGPSSTGLISLGARWPPCMRIVPSVPLTLSIGCPNNTANPATSICSIEDICSFGGFKGKDPNQWFRFITPIFLHAGLVHFLLNMFAQLTLSAQVEREMGSGGFLILYFAGGIFGNVLGGNFALVGAPSVGASGAIFGTVAVMWIDLLAHWKLVYQPVRRLVMLIIDLLVGIALGYIPGVDNFAHLGGFLLGLLSAAIFYPVISTTRTHKLVMWGVRIAAIPVAVVLYVILIKNFYSDDPFASCDWCRYLSCIPTSSNNHCKGSGITTTTTYNRRDFL